MKSLSSEKHFISKKITLLEGEKVLTDDADVAETMNSFFSNGAERLDIKGFSTNDFTHDPDISFIDNMIEKFRNHPSIIKIKEAMSKGSIFLCSV